MNQKFVRFQELSFTYDSMSSPLIESLSVTFPEGWTGIIGANGVGKTTILRLATGDLAPQKGHMVGSSDAVYCRQRTDDPPVMLNDMMIATDNEACQIRGSLNIDTDWPDRWESLSHGERKRAQIAVAIWRRPAILAVDEPTNHLDREARDLLFQALNTYRGIGLLVSHDRELLDGLCCQCLFVDPPHAIMRPGNYSQGSSQAIADEEHIKKQYAVKKQVYVSLRKETVKRRDVASQANRRRSKKGLALKDHDSRFKRNLARISGKDGQRGRLLRQLDGRLNQAREELENTKIKKNYEMGIWVNGSRSKRNFLFRISKGTLNLGGNRLLRFPDLLMAPEDRIAITGPNGGGKSSLIRHILKSIDLPSDKLTYVPQEIDLESTKDIMLNALNLPKDRLGRMMAVVNRLGSRPKRLLESMEPSPGEIRKVLLATGIANEPHLIIMDEPTNHMDLPSIECLEEALSGCPCGLLLVSHDRPFLDRLTTRHWHISREKESLNIFNLQEAHAALDSNY